MGCIGIKGSKMSGDFQTYPYEGEEDEAQKEQVEDEDGDNHETCLV